MTTDEHKAL